MRRRLVGVLVVAGWAASLVVPGAALADTLDQQQPNSDADTAVQAMESEAQTFTAGLTGGLDRVELLLGADSSGPNAPLTVEIRNVSGGSPGTTVLTTGSVSPSAVSSTDTWVPITFATAAPVTAGTQYAIVAYSSVDNTHRYVWGFKFGTPYPAGQPFVQTVSPPGPTWTLSVLIGDQAFKTYVDVPPTAVPAVPTPTAPASPVHKKKCKKKKKHKRAAAAAKKKCKKKKRKR
jgi:hypothetical protein